jgi:Family of unknown function (DUF5825)
MGGPGHPARQSQTGLDTRLVSAVPGSQAEAIALEVIRLRRLMADGTAGSWSAPLPGGLDTRPLHHLPPPPEPAAAERPDDPRLGLWQAAFRPALYYYRLGPGFVQVKDVRDPGSAAWITIDQEPLIDAFLRCGEQPVPVTSQSGDDRAALDILLSEGLLLQFGELVTTAPYRMRHWPIPAGLA